MKKTFQRIFYPYYGLLARLDRAEARIRIMEEAFLVIHDKEEARLRAMNGQEERKKIILKLFSALSFNTVVETGTYLGATTRWLAETTGKPVYSCEIDPWFHRTAKIQLADLTQLQMWQGNSLAFLDRVFLAKPSPPVFFYLDAHWYENLPLADEISRIARSGLPSVICIDDFRVPGDENYGFDVYPNQQRLEMEWLWPSIREMDLQIYYPQCPAMQETGSRRGAVFLATKSIPAQDLLSSGLKHIQPDVSL